MASKINVNWKEVVDLSQRTDENVTEFENARKKLQEITTSLNECWQGSDADNFRTNMNNYLESLKADTEYLLKWEALFKRSAARYNGGVEDGLNRVKRLEEEYIMPNANGVSISNTMTEVITDEQW